MSDRTDDDEEQGIQDDDDVQDLHSDVESIVRARYFDLVEALAREIGGKRRGWQKRVAAILGIAPSTLSLIVNKRTTVSAEVRGRAEERLGIPTEYFLDLDPDSAEEWVRKLPAKLAIEDALTAEAAETGTEKHLEVRRLYTLKGQSLESLRGWLFSRIARNDQGEALGLEEDEQETALELAARIRELDFVRIAFELKSLEHKKGYDAEEARWAMGSLLLMVFLDELRKLGFDWEHQPPDPHA